MEMKRVLVKELYNVDNLSQNRGWTKINERLKEMYPENELIELDFKGINVIKPWDCDSFKDVLSNKNIHMVFTNADEMVDRIKILCIIDNLNKERIKNIKVIPKKANTKEDLKVLRNAERFQDFIECDGDTAEIHIYRGLDQIGSINTVKYIQRAIELYNEKTGVEKFILKTGRLDIQNNIVAMLADVKLEMEKNNGFDFYIDSDRGEVKNRLMLNLHTKLNDEYTLEDRVNAMRKVKENTPGVLIKYKKSRAVDEFGRYGRGEVRLSRVALFKGFSFSGQDEVEVVALFETYNSNYFFTQQHWALEHDGDVLDKLDVEIERVNISELGMGGQFIGSKYHFAYPVQTDENGYDTILDYKDGKLIQEKVTLPERIKIVFDSWGVEYNELVLERHIENTRKILSGNK